MNETILSHEKELPALDPLRVRTFFAGAAIRTWAGFTLPVAAFRVAWAAPSLRSRYIKVAALQLLATVTAAGAVFSINFLDDDVGPFDLLLRFYGALVLVQGLVVALSRDFHDALSHDVALAVGVPPESPQDAPRVRVNTTWIRKEVRHKLRGWLAVAVPFPAVTLIASFLGLALRNLFGPLGVPNKWIESVVGTSTSGVLAFYWIAVFTAAKCGIAWDGEERPPWFVRLWNGLTAKVPGFRWSLPKAYGRALTRFTRFVFAPATVAERDPFLFAGLATARIVFGVPGLYLLLRPLVPVCAAAAVVGRVPAPWPPRFRES